jgi:hypothetical protein
VEASIQFLEIFRLLPLILFLLIVVVLPLGVFSDWDR